MLMIKSYYKALLSLFYLMRKHNRHPQEGFQKKIVQSDAIVLNENSLTVQMHVEICVESLNL